MSTKSPKKAAPAQSGGGMQGFLNAVERIGNKTPHPVLMFAYLIVLVMVGSALLSLFGVSVTDQIAVPIEHLAEPDYYEDTTAQVVQPPSDYEEEHFEIKEVTITANSLLSVEGIRFIFSQFVNNFAGFSVVAVTFIAMLGAGVAEESGMLNALIRKLVHVTPRKALAYLLILIGVISSIASDAGYLILVPLGAAAFLSVGRHPLAGLAACFAGVASIFMVNPIIAPIDAMITEIANEAIGVAGGTPISIVANLFFSIAFSFIMAFVVMLVTERLVEPRLGKYVPEAGEAAASAEDVAPEGEARGLKFAGYGFLSVLVLIVLLTAFPGAPLRHPETGAIIGQTPFMDSLLFMVMLFFLVSGIAYGIGAKTIHSPNDVIKAVTKTFAGLGGMVFMLLMISQFIAFFNYSNMPRLAAVSLAGVLEHANIGAIPLLIGFMLVIVVLDLIMPGSLPKWAIFAPIFVPLFMRLDIAPQTLLAAYRVADSPMNSITPLMVYLPIILTFAQRYQKDAGIGTIVALMMPYAIIVLVVWMFLFIVWFVLGIPLGPGYLPGV